MTDLKILEKSKKIVKELFNELIEKHSDLWDEIEMQEGTYLYKIGEPIKKIYYCEAGISRVFSEDTEIEKEITNGFFSGNEMIIPLFALTKNTPVFLNFQVIEDSLMQATTLKNWKKIEEQEPMLVLKILFETASIMAFRLYQYQKYQSLYSNQARYVKLLEDYPFLNRVKEKYIAEYLGNSGSTISRNLSKPLKLTKR